MLDVSGMIFWIAILIVESVRAQGISNLHEVLTIIALERTKLRPIAAGTISVTGAVTFLFAHLAVMLYMVWHVNPLAYAFYLHCKLKINQSSGGRLLSRLCFLLLVSIHT